jgi:hypothetical protein
LVDRESGCGLDHGEPEFWVSFPAGRDSSPVVEPAVGSFDLPAVAAERIWCLGLAAPSAADIAGAGRDRVADSAASADHRFHAVCEELLADLFAVVATVSPQLRGLDPAREQLFQEREQVPSFVLVAGADADRERCPARVDG